jgi:hypothetical protein
MTQRTKRFPSVLRLLERQYQSQALTFLGALDNQAHKQQPKASPAQLLTVVRHAFNALWGEVFSIESGAH